MFTTSDLLKLRIDRNIVRFGLLMAIQIYSFADAATTSISESSSTVAKITINDTDGTSAAITYGSDSQFNAVGALILASNSFGDNYCTGVLVSPTTFLSARHCDIRTNEFVRFGPDSDNPLFTSAISSFTYSAGGDPSSPLLDGGDFAIITLSTAVPSDIATPLRLTSETTSLVGREAALIGYGGAGLGSSGADSSNVLRWGARNVIEAYGEAAFAGGTSSNIFSTDFDDGTNANNFLGSSSPIPLEGTVAQGDSGGPILVQENGEWLVAGVLSGGTTPGGVYGDVSWWTGVEPFRAEIEAAGGVFIPEPSTSLLLLFSSSIVLFRRHRRS